MCSLAAPEKLYQGFFFSAPSAGSDDANQHHVTAADVLRFEQAVGKKVSWVYFSEIWFESRAFPAATCGWIRSLGKVPYVRLMLRSDLDQRHPEKVFSLENISPGRFDAPLAADPNRMGHGAERRLVCLEREMARSRGRSSRSMSVPTATSWT